MASIRTFAGRAPTLEQLNAALVARRQKEAAAHQSIVNAISAAVAAKEAASTTAATKQVAAVTAAAQQTAAAKTTSSNASTAATTTSSPVVTKQVAALKFGRFSRGTTAATKTEPTVVTKTVVDKAATAKNILNNALASATTGTTDSTKTATTKAPTPASLGLNVGRFSRGATTGLQGAKAGDIVTVNGKQYYYKGPNYTYDISESIQSILDQAKQYDATVNPTLTTEDVSYEKSGGLVNKVVKPTLETEDVAYEKSGGLVNKVQKYPTYTGPTTLSSAKEAQAAIDKYAALFNFSTYDISSNISDIQAQLKEYGVTVKSPSTTTYTSEAAAQAALDSYVAQANAALDTWSKSQPVTVYDDLGREQSISYSQYKQMETWQSKAKSSGTYNTVPEQVANSGADWWINSKGLYEYVPVTASDKAELAKENKQRAQFGQAAKTTITVGATPSAEYSEKWYTTGGGGIRGTGESGVKIISSSGEVKQTYGTRVKIWGSGSVKLAALKASSDINASATAITGTAQTAKVTVWSDSSKASKSLGSSSSKSSSQSAEKTLAELMKINSKTQQNTEKLTITPAADTNTTASKSTFTTGSSALAKYNRATAKANPWSATTNNQETSSTKQSESPWSAQPAAYTQGTKNKLLTYTGTAAEIAALNQQYEKVKAAGYDTSVVASSRGNKSSNYQKAIESAKQAAAQQAALKAAYTNVITKTGKTIDAIEQKGGTGTGEAGVTIKKIDSKTGKIIYQSGTAKEYAQAIKNAQELASTELSPWMPTEQQREILAARKYLSDRGLTTQTTAETALSGAISSVASWMAAHSVAGSEGARVAAGLKNLTRGDLSDNLASGAVSYIELYNKGNAAAASEIKPVFTALESAKQSIWDNTLANTSISLDDSGKIYIDKKGSENKNSKVTFNAKESQDQLISENVVLSGAHQFASSVYDTAKNKPITFALEIAALEAGGALLGGATKIGTTVTRSAFAKTAEKTAVWSTKAGRVGSKALSVTSKAAEVASRSVKPATDIYFTGEIASGLYTSAKMNNYEDFFKQAATLGIMGSGFKRGDVWASSKKSIKSMDIKLLDYPSYKPSNITPKFTDTKISTFSGTGSETQPIDLTYGKTLAVGDTPVISHVSGTGVKGIKFGAAAAPESVVKGKMTQAFSKLETKNFQATVAERGGKVESEYLNSALNIAKQVSKQKQPLYTPETLEITSTAIPEAAKSSIVDAIKSYKGDVTVTGSVPMKAQTKGFVTRETHDLELYADDAAKIAAHISANLKKSGLKEGTDYRLTKDSKIEFPTGKGTGDKAWDIGIEAFTHNSNATPTTILGSGSPAPVVAAKGKSEIAFGYETRAPVTIGKGDTAIKIQNLAEQATRKIAGSTFLHSKEITKGKESIFDTNTLGPAHINRFKDIADTVTTAASYAAEGKVAEKDIVKFVNSAYKKFGGEELGGSSSTDAKIVGKFKEKVASDPVVSFIHENQRLPTAAELKDLGVSKTVASDQTVLYSSKITEPIETGNPMFDALINDGKTTNAKSTGAEIFGEIKTNKRGKIGSESRAEELKASPSPFSPRSEGSARWSPSPSQNTATRSYSKGGNSSPRSSASPSPTSGQKSRTTTSPSPFSSSPRSSPSPSPSSSRSRYPSPSISSPSASPSPTSPSIKSSTKLSQSPNPSSTPIRGISSIFITPPPTSPSPSPWPTSPSPSPSPKSPSSSPSSPSPKSPSPSPSPKSPSSSPSSPSPKSGRGYSPSPSPSPSPSRTKRKKISWEDEDKRRDIAKQTRARDKKMIAKTKVATYSETFGSTQRNTTKQIFGKPKKSQRASPFKNK